MAVDEIAGIWTALVIERRPIFHLISDMDGVALARSSVEVAAATASAKVAKALDVRVGQSSTDDRRFFMEEFKRIVVPSRAYALASR